MSRSQQLIRDIRQKASTATRGCAAYLLRVFADVFYTPAARVVVDAFIELDKQLATDATATGVDAEDLKAFLGLSLSVIQKELAPFVDECFLVLAKTKHGGARDDDQTKRKKKRKSARISWILEPKRVLYAARLAIQRLHAFNAESDGAASDKSMLRCPHCFELVIDMLQFAGLEHDEKESAITCASCKKSYMSVDPATAAAAHVGRQRACNETIREQLLPAVKGLHAALCDAVETERDIARRVDEFRYMDEQDAQQAARLAFTQRYTTKSAKEEAAPLTFLDAEEQKSAKRVKTGEVVSSDASPSSSTFESELDRLMVYVAGKPVSFMKITSAHTKAMSEAETLLYKKMLEDNEVETF